MTKQGIIDKTKAIMNEIGEAENLSLLSEDTVKLEEYIESAIPDAINIIANTDGVSTALLNVGNVISGGTSGDGSLIVPLPIDYLRFVSLRLNGWKREVQTVSAFGSEDYKIQHNPVTRSGVNKPSCVFTYTGDGLCIECFPSGTLQYFNYIKSAADASDGTLSGYSDALMPAICYACAYLVYNYFEMPATAEQMLKIATQVLPKAQ